MIYGNCVGGVGIERTYILVDENGKEYPATFVDNETDFDATPNDIRIGKVAATHTGVIRGEKHIPSYNTQEGYKLITAGSEFKIYIADDGHKYTKLQAIFCPFSTSLSASVAAEKVVIEDFVYPVQSNEAESPVTIDDDDGSVHFGITNTSDGPYLIRYFTYKEVY